MLQSMGSQRVGQDVITEQQQEIDVRVGPSATQLRSLRGAWDADTRRGDVRVRTREETAVCKPSRQASGQPALPTRTLDFQSPGRETLNVSCPNVCDTL